MIKSISIKNFILIDELNIDLKNGYTVITGETGAGKSILLHSIDIALGAKSSKELIKSDKNYCNIEICFEIKKENSNLKNLLTDNGIELYNNELTISKEINQTTSRSRVNGILVTQEFIKSIREFLIDIHTQHQSYTYLQPKFHIELLDKYGDENHKNLVKNFNTEYEKYLQTTKELNKIISTNIDTQAKIDFLRFQINEIESAEITDEQEDIKLDEKLTILTNAGDLKQMSSAVYYALSEDENAILSHINTIKSKFSKYSNIDKEINECSEEIENAIEILRDISSRMRNYSEKIDIDEEKIYEIQNRIEILENLKRKYGKSIEEVIKSYKKFKNELEIIEKGITNQTELEERQRKHFEESIKLAKEITSKRKYLAEKLSEILTKELEKLELPKVRFKVVHKSCDLCATGFDKIEFFISTNISEDLKPLIKIASGGEISRTMLAIKTIFAKADAVETVIFDEIDTGISGTASQAVAEEIKALSKTHQTLCITHQPIIAAKADNHLFVVKNQLERTNIQVYELNDTEKMHAIAMLASGSNDEKSLSFAKQLIGG